MRAVHFLCRLVMARLTHSIRFRCEVVALTRLVTVGLCWALTLHCLAPPVNAASDCNQAADQPLAVVVDVDQTAMAVWAAAHQTISPNYSRLALSSCHHRRCCFSPALDRGAFAFGLRPDLLAQIVANGEPHVLAFPMNADLTMVAVELHGVLSHDRDCKADDGRLVVGEGLVR